MVCFGPSTLLLLPCFPSGTSGQLACHERRASLVPSMNSTEGQACTNRSEGLLCYILP